MIKKLDRAGAETLIRWALEEGWNPGKSDAEVFWNTDPDGFYGFYDEDRLIAGGAVISYDGDFGFMGLFIVHPDYRNQGLGRKLWYLRRDLLLGRLKPGASIGMDGVLAMQSFYAKGGFHIAFRDERYAFKSKTLPSSTNVRLITESDFEKILAYDTIHFGFDRRRFLKDWISMPESKAITYVKDGHILGYAVIRKAETGYKIGPLFADTPEVAEALFSNCLSIEPDELVFLDIPVSNPHAVDLVKTFEGEYVFECARMYYGKAPDIPVEQIYGITTFELG